MDQDTGAVISVEGLKHTYDGKNYALKGVSFDVKKGEVFGLLGKNGAGKSTLIKILTTLIRATEGRVSVLGMDPARDGRGIRRRIGVVQQDESFDFTTVQGNFDLYGVLWGVPRQERVRRREDLIRRFGLEGVRKKRAFDLSGGQKRRVQVAREMMHDVDVLFLDEPTVGLDVIMRRELLDFVKEDVEKGLTVVFTTHNLEEADYLCDRVAVIDSGRVLVMDTVENLKTRYIGKKTIEVTVNGEGSGAFYQRLGAALGGSGAVKQGEGSALVLTDNTKEALTVLLQAARDTGTQIEWLNVRKDTLEDVFLESVSKKGDGE
ncbi:MAG: ABC transporter ATP-binding protein [Nitrososphaerota archaeon]|nr:ABC transporter ATP-binding protein [Nitrososphaerota archaeon]